MFRGGIYGEAREREKWDRSPRPRVSAREERERKRKKASIATAIVVQGCNDPMDWESMPIVSTYSC